jgi:hypothetical protein
LQSLFFSPSLVDSRLTARPTFSPVAGNEADMDVDTNTPRNGLHFLANIIIFAALFLGVFVFVLLTVGMLALMFAQLIGADPTFFLFFFFFFRRRCPTSK